MAKTKQLSYFNKSKGTVLARNVSLADSFFKRLVGLLNKNQIDADEGLYLTKCKCVHMFFMRFAIDVIFVDKNNCVVGLENNLLPFRISANYPQANDCLELAPGAISRSNTEIGDIIESKINA